MKARGDAERSREGVAGDRGDCQAARLHRCRSVRRCRRARSFERAARAGYPRPRPRVPGRHVCLRRHRRVHRAAVGGSQFSRPRAGDARLRYLGPGSCDSCGSRSSIRQGCNTVLSHRGRARASGHDGRLRRVRVGWGLALGEPHHERGHGPPVRRHVPCAAPIDAAVHGGAVRHAVLVDCARPARSRRERDRNGRRGQPAPCVDWHRSHGPERNHPVLYFCGATAFLVGLFDAVERTPAEILFIAVAAGFVYTSVVVHSRTLLAVSTLAILAYTGWFTGEHFVDSVGWPLALMAFGLVLIGMSALAVRLDRNYVRPRRDSSRPH